MLFEDAKKKIPPKKYNELLQHINLRDIFVTEINSKLFERNFPGSAKLQFDESTNLKDFGEDLVEIEVLYKLKAKNGRKKVFDILIKYSVLFELDKEVPEEFFMIYSKHSLPLQTFPYFREYINTILSRMGLPQLILPLRKNLVGKN